MIISYVRRRLQRNPGQTLILIALAGIFAVLLLKLNSSLTLQVQNRQEMLPNISIRCVVADHRGEKTEGLNIPSRIIDYFTREENPLFQFADEVTMKARLVFEIPDLGGNPLLLEELKIEERSMVALTRLEADRSLDQVHGIEITFLPGYNEQSFQETTRYLCLLPRDIYDLIVVEPEKEPEDGWAPLDIKQENTIAVNLLFSTAPTGVRSVGYDMQIAGYYQGGIRDIYCNWQAAIDGYTQIGEPYRADSLSFILRDNSRLDEFREVISVYFVDLGPGLPGGFEWYSLKIHDQQYNTVLYSLDRSIKMLQLVLPLLNILAIGIGFFVSYIAIRNRKHEFALMASLGTEKQNVFSLVFLELALLIVTGICLGTVVYIVTGNRIAVRSILLIDLVFFLCFMAGAAAAIVRILSTNVIAMLSKE